MASPVASQALHRSTQQAPTENTKRKGEKEIEYLSLLHTVINTFTLNHNATKSEDTHLHHMLCYRICTIYKTSSGTEF